MKLRNLTVVSLVLAMLLVACDSEEADISTTTSVMTETTEAPEPAETTTTIEEQAESTTSTSLVGETVTNYEVAARLATDNGPVLHVVIPPGAYTDVDLVNFVGDLKEADPDLWGLEVFDDPAGPDALSTPEDERSEEQQEILEDHHFLTLSNGDRVQFQGPFSEFGEFILAS